MLCLGRFEIENKVQARFQKGDQKWKFGTVCGKKGVLNYEILVDGEKIIRQIVQLRSTDYSESSCPQKIRTNNV